MQEVVGTIKMVPQDREYSLLVTAANIQNQLCFCWLVLDISAGRYLCDQSYIRRRSVGLYRAAERF